MFLGAGARCRDDLSQLADVRDEWTAAQTHLMLISSSLLSYVGCARK